MAVPPEVTVPVTPPVVGGGPPACVLKAAIPAAQYMAEVKVPLNVWALADVSSAYPVTTLAVWAPVLVCCAWVVKPAPAVMAWALLWPATKPTTRSLGAVGVTGPELAAVLVFDVPAETSSGEVVATPANSWTDTAATRLAEVWMVTVVTGLALAAYHISPSELW